MVSGLDTLQLLLYHVDARDLMLNWKHLKETHTLSQKKKQTQQQKRKEHHARKAQQITSKIDDQLHVFIDHPFAWFEMNALKTHKKSEQK